MQPLTTCQSLVKSRQTLKFLARTKTPLQLKFSASTKTRSLGQRWVLSTQCSGRGRLVRIRNFNRSRGCLVRIRNFNRSKLRWCLLRVCRYGWRHSLVAHRRWCATSRTSSLWRRSREAATSGTSWRGIEGSRLCTLGRQGGGCRNSNGPHTNPRRLPITATMQASKLEKSCGWWSSERRTTSGAGGRWGKEGRTFRCGVRKRLGWCKVRRMQAEP